MIIPVAQDIRQAQSLRKFDWAFPLTKQLLTFPVTIDNKTAICYGLLWRWFMNRPEYHSRMAGRFRPQKCLWIRLQSVTKPTRVWLKTDPEISRCYGMMLIFQWILLNPFKNPCYVMLRHENFNWTILVFYLTNAFRDVNSSRPKSGCESL